MSWLLLPTFRAVLTPWRSVAFADSAYSTVPTYIAKSGHASSGAHHPQGLPRSTVNPRICEELDKCLVFFGGLGRWTSTKQYLTLALRHVISDCSTSYFVIAFSGWQLYVLIFISSWFYSRSPSAVYYCRVCSPYLLISSAITGMRVSGKSKLGAAKTPLYLLPCCLGP